MPVRKSAPGNVVMMLVLLAAVTQPCLAQQQILLVGTKHQTPETELVQILPVKDAVLKFNPDIICTEYRKPGDSVSLKYLYGDHHYKKQDSIRKAWNVPLKNILPRINELMVNLKNTDDLFLRMELRNLFFLRSDFGNAEYQAFMIMEHLKTDSSQIIKLKKRFPMFEQMRSGYRKRIQNHDEYNFLVFPIARQLSLVYLNPIDDQSTNREYEKYFSKLQNRDTVLESRKAYYDRIDAFFRKMGTLPPETNTWVYSNSPEIIADLMYVEAYKLDAYSTSQDVKMLSYYWTLRNKKMAGYIAQVAKKNPGKKIVVFFGASHVGPVQEELKKLSKKLSVQTLYDVID